MLLSVFGCVCLYVLLYVCLYVCLHYSFLAYTVSCNYINLSSVTRVSHAAIRKMEDDLVQEVYNYLTVKMYLMEFRKKVYDFRQWRVVVEA